MNEIERCFDDLLRANHARLSRAQSDLDAGAAAHAAWPTLRQQLHDEHLPELQRRRRELQKLKRPVRLGRLRYLTARVAAYRVKRWIDPRILLRCGRIVVRWVVLNIERIIDAVVVLLILGALAYAAYLFVIHGNEVAAWFGRLLDGLRASLPGGTP